MINIRKRGNVYQYGFEVGKVNGKRKQITKSGFRTKNEAFAAGQKAYNEFINGGIKQESEMFYSDYLDYWMKEYFEINYKYSTARRYKETFGAIKKELGMYKLNAITPYLLNQVLLKLYQKTSTKEALRNYQKVIKSSLRDAAYYFGFIQNNPAGDLQIPRVLSFELKKNDITHIYSSEEINKIINRFNKNKTFVYSFLTACYTGMRTGEVFALTWNDIDFENKTIRVTKNAYYKRKNKKGRWYLGTTKTENSSRTIYMCDTLCNLLKKYKTEQENNKKEYKENYKYYNLEQIKNKHGKLIEYQIVESKKSKNNTNMVFVKTNGTYSGADLIKYPFKIIHYELGIKCRFYDLRGSFATTTLRSGVEIKDISKVLGHSKIETTENYYITSTIDTLKNVSETFEKEIDLTIK